MIITRAPFRISFFGGSSDYKDFFSKHGSFLIGTTIDKYSYTSCRFRPHILSNENIVSYSEVEKFKEVDDVKNPLIRESIKQYNFFKKLDIHLFADIPSRTGLGGSSSCCCSLIKGLSYLEGKEITKKELAKIAIKIEREILKESGGTQDQIWAAYGGFNSIEINTDGDFFVKPMPVSEEFKKEFENSLCLVYANQQRDTAEIAKSHIDKDRKNILHYSKEAYNLFIREDIESIFKIFLDSWEEKKNLSPLIMNPKLTHLEKELKNHGAKSLKLLGSGGCGFFLCMSDPYSIKNIKENFRDLIFNFSFEEKGSEQIFIKK